MLIKEYSDLIEMFKWNKIDILVHGANCLGGVMGAGIALSIREAFPQALETDIQYEVPTGKARLGNISVCELVNQTTNNTQYIVNAYTQETLRSRDNACPFEIEALKNCLEKIYFEIEKYFPKLKNKKAINIGFPYIGAGLGGGNKNEVEELITFYANHQNKFKINTFLVDFNNDLLAKNKINAFREEYSYLSNFQYLSNPIYYDGKLYYSVEAAYMAAKADYLKKEYENGDLFNEKSNNEKLIEEWKEYCSTIKPDKQGEMKKKSRELPLDNEEWDKHKLKLMYNFVYQKFANNKTINIKLQETGDRLLVEGNYWNDIFWGVCLKTGKGENQLGRIIMKVREKLR